ncbi:Cyanate hydratase [Plenodomus lingam]|uniref:Cyanate hydratase n=1 Tax=Leptosphaeria maculans (strain JN3 / isolate v23.1.3 / race Av1-4-5-6-7-8) TaxID=985895 RepID=E5A550_LEPMJ|nr:hypothetical protein LEMA_P079870.1 [Plenodomus lingam JN3]KAH9867038.1 Cyanate hydratase [Plenodomus lingam]CBX98748.1 hypothetical protein LEMA_P079870.1 [Plenodomus lingam JN3]
MALPARLARSTRLATRTAVPITATFARSGRAFTASRCFHFTPSTMSQHPIATLNEELKPRLPPSSISLFEAKKKKNLSFEAIAKHVGRDEVAVAALFYGQAMASAEDITKLAEVLEISAEQLESDLSGFPNRGSTLDMPPKDPTIYRLYEIVQNYGQAYKAVLHEKFGDGIMSAISFSTKIEKETDEKGEWAKITMRGKWLPYTRF